MTPEDRIEALEKEVAKLREDLAMFVRIYQGEGGQAAAYQAAVTSLMHALPPNALLDKILQDKLNNIESNAVAVIKSEEYLDGLQLVQKLILQHREEAHRLYKEGEPANGAPVH